MSLGDVGGGGRGPRTFPPAVCGGAEPRCLNESAVHLVRRLEAQKSEGAEHRGSCDRSKIAFEVGADDEAILPAAKDGFGGRAVVTCSSAAVDDRIPLVLGAEVSEPGLPGELAALGAAGEVRDEKFGEAGHIFLGDAEQEAVPVDPGGEQVVVGEKHGGDTGAHDFEEADTAGSGAAWAEHKVGGGEGFGIAALASVTAGLGEVPVEVGGGVLDQDVGAAPGEIEKALAQHGGAAALEGEEKRPGRCGGWGDEGIGVPAVAGDVGVAKGAAGTAAAVIAGGAIHAGKQGEVVVVFGVDDGLLRPSLVERVSEQALGLGAEAADEEDEVGGDGVGGDGVEGTAGGACRQESGELGLVDGCEMDLHGGARLHCAIGAW